MGTMEAYIRAMQKNLKDRLEEHKHDIKLGNLITALAKRAYKNDVTINWNEAKIICNVTDPIKVSTAEKLNMNIYIYIYEASTKK